MEDFLFPIAASRLVESTVEATESPVSGREEYGPPHTFQGLSSLKRRQETGRHIFHY